MTFKEKVEIGIEGLSVKQKRAFAWRCAVRSLPFLGIAGTFSFWSKDKRAKHLLSIFYALDFSYAKVISATLDVSEDAAEAADTAATHAFSATNSYAENSGEVDAAAAASAMADAASFSASDSFAKSANSASAAAFSEYTFKVGMQSIILQDLKNIKTNKKQQISISTYGEVWDYFQFALKNEGCEYWGKLYKNIFSNNFEVDQEALENRLSVPKEISAQGAAVAANYLEELEKGSQRLNEARIIILGEKGVGKTCVARKLVDPSAPMTTPSESTPGVDTSLWKLEEDNINIRIWDFAGHTVTHAVHQFFLSERCLYIMVYDGRTEDRNRLEYWLDHMKNYGKNSQAIILVNERDQHPVKIPINALMEKYPIAGFYSFDVDNDKKGLANFRDKVADYIKNNPSWRVQQIPTSYYQVKEELEDLFSNNNEGKEHIEKDTFLAIAKKYKVEDTDRLLEDLHFLGVSLWYKEMEHYDTLILNPEWISQGVYKIINWISAEKKHNISLDSFTEVFSEEESRYPKTKHKFLFDLIKHYELGFESKPKKRLIIPHLLKEDQPSKLPAFDREGSLMMRYEATHTLPINTISRFIVRHNEQIKKEGKDYLVWKYGVILEDRKGNLALVREIDRVISISVKGESKTDYISEIRDTLNNIFDSYVNQMPELTYRVIDDQVNPKQELYLAERDIVAHVDEDRQYFDSITRKEIALQPTAVHYNITHHHYHISAAETILIGGEHHQVVKTTFNFKDCNLDLQGALNELAQKLVKKGNEEDAEELTDAAELLDTVKDVATKEEVKKKGIGKRLRRIAEDLGDKNSTLYKTVEGLKRGASMAQDFAKEYNKIAQWLGMPQVPKPFLKE